MREEARKNHYSDVIQYICLPIEEFEFPKNHFDIVLSSLAFHYIESFEEICKKVHHCLTPGGSFIFSVEHPVFTAEASQSWHLDESGKNLHWPIDRYFEEVSRQSVLLCEKIVKYHKTLTNYLNGLLQNGFEIKEPQPTTEMLNNIPGMKDELRRPMMLIISSIRK